ncbi:putative reverse transcriptase domain-containing protein, partial [Tanacetum coccineum]
RKMVRSQPPLPVSIKIRITEYAAAPIPPSPPPSPLSPLSPPLPKIPSPPLLLPSYTHSDIIPKADMPLQKRARFTAPSHMFEIGEEVNDSVADMATRHRQDSEDFYTRHQDAQDDRALLCARVSTLARERRYYHHMTCVADALADYEVNRGSRNEHDNHDSGSGRRRPVHTARVCTYKDFLNCQPLNFKGTEGVVGLTQWFEKMEYVFHISSCTVKNQVKYATCTLHGNALTWSEIKKLEIEIWNLKVKGTDVVENYVSGLPDMIQGNVMSARPKTLQEAIELENDLMHQKVRTFAKRAYTAGPGENKEYGGTSPLCTKCNYHHNGSCIAKCTNCRRIGHLAHDCRSPAAANNQRAPKNKNRGNQVGICEARGKAYVLGGGKPNLYLNVVTGTLLLNNHYASILFDTGADRSFVSTAFSSLIDIIPTALNNYYDLSKYHDVIVYDENIVRVPFGNETLIIRGNESNHGSESRLNIISCNKTQKYLLKGCHVFLAQITEKKAKEKSEEKRLKDVPVVQDIPKVFPEDWAGVPPTRQVEFQIDLVPGVAPVARAPYRLAPSEMKELSDQLQELSDKGFIRPSPHLEELWFCLSRRRMDRSGCVSTTKS